MIMEVKLLINTAAKEYTEIWKKTTSFDLPGLDPDIDAILNGKPIQSFTINKDDRYIFVNTFQLQYIPAIRKAVATLLKKGWWYAPF